MSIVEQAYIAYSKKLLDGEIVGPHFNDRMINKDKINEFIPKLDVIINDHPEYDYPAFYKAKLLLA